MPSLGRNQSWIGCERQWGRSRKGVSFAKSERQMIVNYARYPSEFGKGIKHPFSWWCTLLRLELPPYIVTIPRCSCVSSSRLETIDLLIRHPGIYILPRNFLLIKVGAKWIINCMRTSTAIAWSSVLYSIYLEIVQDSEDSFARIIFLVTLWVPL